MLALRVSVSCVLLASLLSGMAAQQAEYVDYRTGTLNLVIAAPHGGNEKPNTIKDRTAGCYNNETKKCTYRHDCTPDYNKCPVTTVHDSYTFEAAEKIRFYVHKITGKYPYFVANKLHRVKLDPNRAIDEAAFGEPVAVANYEYYHNMIVQSKAEIDKTGLYNSLLVIDVHGQSHSHNLTELGYNLTASELDKESYALQGTSTLKYAANKLGNTNAIIIGNVSIGQFFEDLSIPSIPSPVNPTIKGRPYFTGGYTVQTHCSKDHDAIQFEFARTIRFAEQTAFDTHMENVAKSLNSFMKLHYSEKSSSSASSRVPYCLLLLIAVLAFRRAAF